MLKFVKKLIIFSKTKKGLIREDEIKSVSDKEATEFLEKMPIESLIDLDKIEKDEIFLRKDILNLKDGYIACIGPPSAGKSSLCNAFYKTLYGINKELFYVSNSTLSFTKGLWILKEREKQNIKQNMFKDIIDVEGFQVDDITTWKSIMISAYISTDIIILNRNTRLDAVIKILNIICNSLDKMKILGIPYLLKNIWVQIDDEDEKEKCLEYILKDCFCGFGFFDKFKDKEIKIDMILIEQVDKKTYKKVGGNLLEVEDYLKQVKTAFEKILGRSISNPFQYIDNFYNILNKIDIREVLKKDFENVYSSIKKRKEEDLLKKYKIDSFKEPLNSNETFNEFINRQSNIDFSISVDDVKCRLTFFYDSEECDKIYNEFIKERDFKVDPLIFRQIYNTLIEKVRLKEELEMEMEKLKKQKLEYEERLKREKEISKKYIEKQQAYEDYKRAKIKIEKYFSDLKFYDNIDSFSPYKYNINGDYDNETKNNYNKKLEDYYYEKEKMKREEWENQIERSKYECEVHCYGDRFCINGHTISGDCVGCESCGEKGIEFNKRLLYWVDGETHHAICRNCNKVRKMNETMTCYCGAKCYSLINFNSDYKP